jgi:hypothetical protein
LARTLPGDRCGKTPSDRTLAHAIIAR